MSTEKQGPVGVITWHHEEQNRFNTPFIMEFLEALAAFEADEGVTAVVITSNNPKIFSTGLYLDWIIATANKDIDLLREFLGLLGKMLAVCTGYPKPLIAALNGHTVAAGAILAACMDYRLMNSERGFVRLPEVQIDIPFWPGMTAILKDAAGEKCFREMAYTGGRFTAEQAKQMGFVDQTHPPDELLPKAIELGTKLGLANMATYSTIKRGNRSEVLRIMAEEDPQAAEQFIARMSASLG
ncbi:MAG: enoyl-CoA hydratase/isomerase family protein [Candidatus Alcyoniella australis]|nr:enoyl-CoA hydratase/isomerase family protein [Candidatus Alcyoniella australis]